MRMLARLRTDHAETLARIVDPQGPFVAHLRDEVAYWRVQATNANGNAARSRSTCRTMHAQIGPVSPPLRDEHAPRDTQSIFQSSPNSP